MKNRLYVLLASSSILALTSTITAHAADPAAPPSQQVAQDAGIANEEIIVTARRKAENLQDVPETVNAITAADVQKYNIIQLTDISKLAPTMQVNPQSGYTGGSGSLRGLNYGVSNYPESVQFYINDAPIDQTFQYMSLYDIGDIEVLRGPQGVTRGKIAPVGSFTLTTRLPDLEKIGGYVEGTVGNQGDTNFQGAIGIPIVQDKFAIRIAAIRDENDDNETQSFYNQEKPNKTRQGGRVTARLEPTDDIQAVVSFQHMQQRELYYPTADFGPGNAAGGPALTPGQNLTIEPGIDNDGSNFNDLEAKFDWTFHGQKLEAVTGYGRYHFVVEGDANGIDQVPNLENFNSLTNTVRKEFNQDVRISSVEPLWGRVDYTVGYFYDHVSTDVDGSEVEEALPGAFVGNSVVPSKLILVDFLLPQDGNENAVYGSATFHITSNDEITAGLRHGLQEQHDVFSNTVVPAAHLFLSVQDVGTYHPTIYNIEASHKFNEDLMVWLRTGSSWRYGAVNPALVLTTNNNPIYFPYEFPSAPETSKDYEGGVKGSLFDKRVTFDADYFHQTYHNFLGFPGGQAVWHLSGSGVPAYSATYGTVGLELVPSAKIDGIEINATGRITKEWNVTGAFGWANGNVSGNLPCNPAGITQSSTSAQALAALTAGGKATYVNLCPGSAAAANIPKWNFNISSEYDQPIMDELQGFARALLNYHPSNPNSGFTGYVVPAYATLDAYLGVRQPDAQWEVSLYAKNLTDNRTLTQIGAIASPSAGLLGFSGANSAGYDTILQQVPRREIGITARYAFGSR